MSQHVDAINETTHYTRVDFTALRASLFKIETADILQLYYCEDDLLDRGIDGPVALRRFLEGMRDDLIGRLIDINPDVAESLQHARQSSVWSKKAIDYLIGAADAAVCSPRLSDPVTLWFRSVAAKRLKEDGIGTLGQLMDTIRARGKGWYRPIPCLGHGKASTIVRWLQSYEETLGRLPHALAEREDKDGSEVLILNRFSRELAPLSRMRPAGDLDGSKGINRHHLFPLISARTDYDAIQAYLYKFRGREKTYRSYKKELERFLLWCISERGKAMSSILIDDCEAYKDFLAHLPPRWVGLRTARTSPDWRPFAGNLSHESQRYAHLALRAFFKYLVGVRYLAANTWAAVSSALVEKQIHQIQIGKALPAELWEKLSINGGILDQLCELRETELKERYQLKGFAARQNVPAQLRLVRAIILLLGNTGMRREEVAFACRRHLAPFPQEPSIWRLAVLGKGVKWRNVFPTDREVNALRAHWQDRGEDFSFSMTDLPLVSPIIIPPTTLSQQKHGTENRTAGAKGFSPDGIYSAVTSWLKKMSTDDILDLTTDERCLLHRSGIHAFRHTFATQALADGMTLTVVQNILGHASLDTTTIYLQTEDRVAAAEVSRRMAKKHKKTQI